MLCQGPIQLISMEGRIPRQARQTIIEKRLHPFQQQEAVIIREAVRCCSQKRARTAHQSAFLAEQLLLCACACLCFLACILVLACLLACMLACACLAVLVLVFACVCLCLCLWLSLLACACAAACACACLLLLVLVFVLLLACVFLLACLLALACPCLYPLASACLSLPVLACLLACLCLCVLSKLGCGTAFGRLGRGILLRRLCTNTYCFAIRSPWAAFRGTLLAHRHQPIYIVKQGRLQQA